VHSDYVSFSLAALFVVVGAGLFRVGLMSPKSESSEDTRKRWLFIAFGIAFGIAAVVILILKAMKMGD
jgi:heme/copper-type cytochrome/quinol oxidase subunit 2